MDQPGGPSIQRRTSSGLVCASQTSVRGAAKSRVTRTSVSLGSETCAVITGGKSPGTPCGICRQVLVEFTRDMPVVLVCETDTGDVRRDTTLAELMPDVFEFDV